MVNERRWERVDEIKSRAKDIISANGPMTKKELADKLEQCQLDVTYAMHGGPFVKDDTERWHIQVDDEEM